MRGPVLPRNRFCDPFFPTKSARSSPCGVSFSDASGSQRANARHTHSQHDAVRDARKIQPLTRRGFASSSAPATGSDLANNGKQHKQPMDTSSRIMAAVGSFNNHSFPPPRSVSTLHLVIVRFPISLTLSSPLQLQLGLRSKRYESSVYLEELALLSSSLCSPPPTTSKSVHNLTLDFLPCSTLHQSLSKHTRSGSSDLTTMPSMSDFTELQALLAANESWAKSTAENDPELLPALACGQKPGVLWIGCADSRVPETSVLGQKPGDVFVHVSTMCLGCFVPARLWLLVRTSDGQARLAAPKVGERYHHRR